MEAPWRPRGSRGPASARVRGASPSRAAAPASLRCARALRSEPEPGRPVGFHAASGREGTSARKGEPSAGGPALIKPATKQNNPPSVSRDTLQSAVELLRPCLSRLRLCGKQWLRWLSAVPGRAPALGCQTAADWVPLLPRQGTKHCCSAALCLLNFRTSPSLADPHIFRSDGLVKRTKADGLNCLRWFLRQCVD